MFSLSFKYISDNKKDYLSNDAISFTNGTLSFIVDNVNISSLYIQLSSLLLTYWLLDNWWDIHIKLPYDKPIEFLMTHQLPSISHGYQWPNISLYPCNKTYIRFIYPPYLNTLISIKEFDTQCISFFNNTIDYLYTSNFTDIANQLKEKVNHIYSIYNSYNSKFNMSNLNNSFFN